MASFKHLSEEFGATRQPADLVVEDEILLRLTIADYLRGGGLCRSRSRECDRGARGLRVRGSRWTSSLLMCRCPALWTGSCSCAGSTSIILASKCWSPPESDAAVSSGVIHDDAFFSKPYALKEVAGRIHSSQEGCRN